MVKRYAHCQKDCIFYIVYIFSLDEGTRAQEYEIQFTKDQNYIIKELFEILNEYQKVNNRANHREVEYYKEEDENLDQYDQDDVDNENNDDIQEDKTLSDSNIDDNEEMDENYSLLLM